MSSIKSLRDVLANGGSDLLGEWLREQLDAPTLRRDLINDTELRDQSNRFLSALTRAVNGASSEEVELANAEWTDVREFLSELTKLRARQGFSPTDTAMFVFSLKQPLFERLRKRLASDPHTLTDALVRTGNMLDSLGLMTTEAFQKTREEIISRQQQDMLELSTPVVELWDGILALPLIGTLDSARTQVVMESLLGRIVETGAGIAIIDITGVATVDTLVAQHLLKTVAAARLMGAECIISGIRPQIAQTIVHLGVDLGQVVTKASLASAFAVALERLDMTVAPRSAVTADARSAE